MEAGDRVQPVARVSGAVARPDAVARPPPAAALPPLSSPARPAVSTAARAAVETWGFGRRRHPPRPPLAAAAPGDDAAWFDATVRSVVPGGGGMPARMPPALAPIIQGGRRRLPRGRRAAPLRAPPLAPMPAVKRSPSGRRRSARRRRCRRSAGPKRWRRRCARRSRARATCSSPTRRLSGRYVGSCAILGARDPVPVRPRRPRACDPRSTDRAVGATSRRRAAPVSSCPRGPLNARIKEGIVGNVAVRSPRTSQGRRTHLARTLATPFEARARHSLRALSAAGRGGRAVPHRDQLRRLLEVGVVARAARALDGRAARGVWHDGRRLMGRGVRVDQSDPTSSEAGGGWPHTCLDALAALNALALPGVSSGIRAAIDLSRVYLCSHSAGVTSRWSRASRGCRRRAERVGAAVEALAGAKAGAAARWRACRARGGRRRWSRAGDEPARRRRRRPVGPPRCGAKLHVANRLYARRGRRRRPRRRVPPRALPSGAGGGGASRRCACCSSTAWRTRRCRRR